MLSNFIKLDCKHTWYLSPRSPTCRWRRNLPCGEISDFNTWNFSTWRGISVFPHNRCGEMWIFAKFGEISHFSTGQMWRNLKFIQFFVIKSVLRCFCEIRFGAIYALLRGENFCKKLGRWRKNDKYQVCNLVLIKSFEMKRKWKQKRMQKLSNPRDLKRAQVKRWTRESESQRCLSEKCRTWSTNWRWR